MTRENGLLEQWSDGCIMPRADSYLLSSIFYLLLPSIHHLISTLHLAFLTCGSEIPDGGRGFAALRIVTLSPGQGIDTRQLFISHSGMIHKSSQNHRVRHQILFYKAVIDVHIRMVPADIHSILPKIVTW